MPDSTIALLLGTAVMTSLFHTAIPDHWLPFVLIGRARRWTAGRTAFLSGLSATIHVVLSIALGLIALAVGEVVASALGAGLEHAGPPLLVAFGLGYAIWSWRKGGHFHPGGARVHGGDEDDACEGGEGPGHPDHLHYHADDGLIREGPRGGELILAVLVGINPCVLVLPLLLETASRGAAAVVWVSLAYASTTAALMVGLSVGGVVGTSRIRLPGAARHMEAASGILIALLGAALLFLE